MFTGLIEHVGTVRSLVPRSEGTARLRVDLGPLSRGTRLGDSIAIDGCCLTVAELQGVEAEFDAVAETLRRTTLGALRPGDLVNLERALLPGSTDTPKALSESAPQRRLGGHFVQGHVDGTATVRSTGGGLSGGEWHFTLDDPAWAPQLVEKGSIAVDGISLTVAGCDGAGGFWVALIPETLRRTALGRKTAGAKVNLETDILGKYVLALLARQGRSALAPAPAPSRISEEWLKEQGY